MHQNISLGSNGVDPVLSLRKIPTQVRGTNFCTSSARFAPSFVRQPNGPECTQIVRNVQNISLGSNGVDRVRSLQKIPTRPRGTNFCTSLARFAPSFVRQPNGPECTQIVRNTQKRQFRVQWGGSGAFVVKKLRRDLVARTFALVRPVLHRVS
jgi:ribosomal protein L34E